MLIMIESHTLTSILSRMASEVLQSSSTLYTLLKDMLRYMKGKAKYVKKLEDNLTMLIAELGIFYSRKTKIDQYLETAVSKEKSNEYEILTKQIDVFHKRCCEFVDKYKGLCQDLPNFQIEDVVGAIDVIGVAQERKSPSIVTRKFFQLAELSRSINELLQDISQVTGRMILENVLDDKKVEPVVMKRGDIYLPSSAGYVEKILSHISEDGNRSIGILGPIGVGKTTILKKLNDQLKHTSFPLSGNAIMKRKFEFVIWLDHHKQHGGARDDSTLVIQDVIMARLKLEREKTSYIHQNADIISNFLCNRKYILLIDQVFSTINLDELGIHKDHTLGKVVIASNNRKVITQMTDQLVEILPLSKDDALDLFQEVCGTIRDTRIIPIAQAIIESCGGLPTVISLVALYLKGQGNDDVWHDVKGLLQSEAKGNLQALAGVGHAYKLVYDKLEKSEQKCLLFAALFPSDYKIHKDYLVECWNAERFLELGVPGLRRARERGAKTLTELTDKYLLENHSDKHVKMPQYFRKVAFEQKYPGESGSLSWNPQRIHPLSDETWETSKRMSLICCKSKLPRTPSGENITTLLMQCNRDLVSLEDEFFLRMQKLCILDLHRTMITSLPTSISRLENLRCLYLNDCPLLAELPKEVKELKKLELLDIRGTSIRSLSNELSDTLRCLRISFGQTGCNRYSKCKEVVMEIPHEMISGLCQLEELTIEAGCCNIAWKAYADQIVNAIASLEKLSTLNLHFPNVSTLEIFVSKSKSLQNIDTHWMTNTLRSFNICIGCRQMILPHSSEIYRILPERQLTFSTSEEISSVKELLRQANSFALVDHHGVISLSDFDLKNAGALKVCVVKDCINMTSLVLKGVTEEADWAALGCLEKLELVNLQALQTIWKGPIFRGSLASLKELTLFGCSGMSTVLNHEEAEALSSLEYVRVEKCKEVVEIVHEKIYNERGVLIEGVDVSNVLNKVMTIEMVELPKLKSICNTAAMKWKSLTRVVVTLCDGLGNIHRSMKNVEKLETIECDKIWWMGLQMPDEQKQRFLPCCEFIAMETKPAEGESSSSSSSSSSTHRTSNGK